MVLACVKYKRTTRKAKAAALLLRETRKEELAAIRAEGEAEVAKAEALLLRETREEELAAIRAEGAKRRSRRSGRHP